MQNIVIVGGGFAGMWAALTAARELDGHADIGITLVSRDEYLTVRPRLYEVFSEGMRAPLGPTIAPVGINLQVGDAQSIDLKNKAVSVTGNDGKRTQLAYDRLVLAGGSEQRPLGIPGAAEFALDVDTFAGAQAFDHHLSDLLNSPDLPGRLTFVVVGAGFTGIEMATEMRNHIRAHSNGEIASKARVILIEREKVVGPDLGINPRPVAEAALRDARVEVRLGASIEKIEKRAIVLTSGERIETSTVVITAGLRANPLAQQLNATLDKQGRVVVDEMLRVNGVPEVFAAGDIACAQADAEHAALMSCQHAIPMGKHAGYNVAHDLLGSPLRAYSQPYYVTCLDLGESGALFTLGWDRKPDKMGAEAKQLKAMINTQWIYPPKGTRAAIIAAADLDAPWPPAV